MDPLLDTAPCGYIAFTDEGVVRTANATAAKLLGYSAEELSETRFENLLGVGARIFYHTHFFPILKLHGEAEEVYLTLRSRGRRGYPRSDEWHPPRARGRDAERVRFRADVAACPIRR